VLTVCSEYCAWDVYMVGDKVKYSFEAAYHMPWWLDELMYM
jgi:hypothetical protein